MKKQSDTVEVGGDGPHLGIAGTMARMFIDSKLTPLFIVASILLGLASIILLPREEEPQIIVPMIDVMVSMPGAGAEEVAERVTRPLEKLLWEISDVEYLYSMSSPGEALVIVRFKVGTNVEKSLVLLNQKLQMNYDRIPHGVSMPLIKPRSIDDVPILALTFHSSRYDGQTLRALAAQVDDRIKGATNVAETRLIGGRLRTVRVLLDPAALAARGLTAAGIVPMLQQANRQSTAGGLPGNNREVIVQTGGFLETVEDVRDVVVGVAGGHPVYLRDVATVSDGAAQATDYVFFVPGAATSPDPAPQPAVTLTVAKRPGANAISVAEDVLKRVDSLRGSLIPADVEVTVTRHYGETAAEKSNELLFHMAIAVVGVSLLILFVLGWRESIIVAVAIPTTLALTLLVFYLYGYTLNRITLFALIFSIGILVDDAIVVVENIVRHLHLPENRGRGMSVVAVEAVAEVGNPTILATLAVIAAILPMAFVGGLMGPYMRPIPVGATAAMAWSLLVAFMVTPWAARRILRSDSGHGKKSGHGEGKEDFFTRLYRRVMDPLIHHPAWQGMFLLGCVVMLLGSMALVGIGWVKVKMLPFDNKSEFQVILNMPEGSSLERTAQVAREMAEVVRREPEVTDIQVYVGTSAPFNFNGLVRHYFLRSGNHVADLQINLEAKHHRKEVSHEIAKRVRPALTEIASRFGGRVAVAEVPPGPPVLQTIVAEIYGPSAADRLKLAEAVKEIFRSTEGVVDVDWYIEADQPESRFVIDREKAALSGISTETISKTLQIAVGGLPVDLLHDDRAREDVNIMLEIPESEVSRPEDLLALRVRPGDGNALIEPPAGAQPTDLTSPALIPLREIVQIESRKRDKTVHRKNLLPVTYVIADVAGVVESPVYAILGMNTEIGKLDGQEFGGGAGSRVKIYNAFMPSSEDAPAIKWDGEWHITIEVFRDLGMAFAAVLVLIYLLMVGWFRSFLTPLIVMAAIPFSLVGILPAHGMMGAFFTATSMIGFMAGAGIVVRNSIILVDFIEQRLREGMPLADAVVDAGAVRFRPMLLTAMAVVVGASVILADPIFQGLAISLMAGEIASLLLSRLAVPVLYYMANRKKHLSA